MKNYYEILQVDEKASSEIIEKAYKVLVKKYHPDLQKDIKKKELLEDKLKQINEAYDILSDSFLREQYDAELLRQRDEELKSKYGEKYYGTEKTKFYDTNSNKRQQYYSEKINMRKQEFDEQQERKRQAQNLGTIDGVIDLVKELYSNRPKRKDFANMTKKDIFAILLTVIIVLIIGIILWFIPFTNGWIREILFENPISKLFQ